MASLKKHASFLYFEEVKKNTDVQDVWKRPVLMSIDYILCRLINVKYATFYCSVCYNLHLTIFTFPDDDFNKKMQKHVTVKYTLNYH